MEQQWINCKTKVNSMPRDYERLMKEMMAIAPHKVEKKENKANKAVSVICHMNPIEGFDVTLHIIKSPERYIRVWYLAWDPEGKASSKKGATCFLRDVLAEDPTNEL